MQHLADTTGNIREVGDGACAGQRNPRAAPGRGPPPRFDEPEDIEFVRLLRGHTKQVTAAALDPSGQTLYTGSQDGTVRCWSTATAQVRLTLLVTQARPAPCSCLVHLD